MRYGLTFGMVTTLGLLLCSSVPAADGPENAAKAAKEEVYRLWPVDSMIRQAADNVARRYNLNPQQTEHTRRMMQERVMKFLEENEEAIWPLVRDLARQQLSGPPGDSDTARRIGETALPLVEKAKKAILEANTEWGQILTSEQKKLHEYDLREMQGTFEEINRNFDRWKNGDPVPNPIFPQYQPKPDEPPRPPRPPSMYRPPKHQEDRWDKFVQDFIRKYQLDGGQKRAATSILSELKQRAKDYRASKTEDFDAVAKRLNEAYASGDLRKQADTTRDEKVLNAPLDKMFEELKQRLENIPTAAQKKAAQEAAEAKALQARQRKEATSRPTSRPTTQPTTQPHAQPKPPPQSQPSPPPPPQPGPPAQPAAQSAPAQK